MATKLFDAYQRLTVWIRDYGHEKQPAFIEDLQTVLDAVRVDAIEAEDAFEQPKARIEDDGWHLIGDGFDVGPFESCEQMQQFLEWNKTR